MSSRLFRWLVALPALGLVVLGAHAQTVISDTLTGASSQYPWQSLAGACLTAGDGTGTIPKCVGLPYYTSRGSDLVGGVNGSLGSTGDPVGSGALRLTDGGSDGTNQTGAVYSQFDFPSNQGVEVTFKTVTYGGNSYQNSANQKSGADGIAFFLVNGDLVKSVDANTKTGAYGGSLGYSCANAKDVNDGLQGAYVGLGIDEFGNFSNPGDNTASGSGSAPGRVSLRGAGNINWTALNSQYPNYYPSTVPSNFRQLAVGNTCRTGTLWNYTNAALPVDTGVKVLDYPLIATSALTVQSPIFNQEGVSNPKRGAAKAITYGLKITQDGLLSLNYSYDGGAAQTVINKQLITASNGALPSKFRFGFSSGTGGGSNVHEIVCFKAAPVNVAASSAGINIQQSAQVQVGSQIYLAFYHPVNWWGQLSAKNLVINTTNNTVSINPTANWDASCVLTGGACASTGVATTAQASAARTILTSNNSIGIPFQWTNLGSGTGGQQAVLTAGDTPPNTANRLNYLRGDRTNELTSSGTGTYRLRDSVLGDIVNSSPTWVGPPQSPFTSPWKDLLAPSTTMPEGSTTYSAFATANATRTNVVYAGSNDGLLHGFRAGAYTAGGDFDTTALNDGRELLAYMPAMALNTIHSNTTAALDFSSPQYGHNAFVDATPGTGDLYYGGQWHTWLVGGLGAGGNAGGVIGDNTTVAKGAIYALDVTTPTAANFAESNAANLVLGEWSSSTLPCAATDVAAVAASGSTPAVAAVSCQDNLGSTYGTPIIRRMHDGNWAVIFGNGLNSKNGGAGIFIMTVDQTTGARTFRYLSAGPGSGPTMSGSTVTARNGIAYVSSADLDGDHVIDYLYAGDVFGNVWRFDVTSATAGNWAVRSTAIFYTGGKPITSRLTVSSVVAASTAPRLMVTFGTGQIYPQTLTSAATPTTGTQYMFGIWDWDMAAWNNKGSAQYTSLATAQTVTTSSLQSQTVTTDTTYSNGLISGARTVTRNTICWQGSTACTTGNTKFGWSVQLPGANEQIIYNPIVSDGLFLVNTTLPAVNQALSCDQQPASGFTMAIDPATGAPPASSFFGDATNNFVSATGQIVAGIGLSGVGSPSIVSAGTKKYLATQTVSGQGSVTQVNPGSASGGGRLTWIKMR
ncbi:MULTISPECIES: pilus assembly protein [unclassified Variovorax]|uniref:pilus assembly protein n=1 Tax=unclassified Variovorax TaxID=663243 RepID=UPI001BD2ABE7|nr:MULTISPECIES: PilC/PilY family type IV pilus protein [unclassified Variovorax]